MTVTLPGSGAYLWKKNKHLFIDRVKWKEIYVDTLNCWQTFNMNVKIQYILVINEPINISTVYSVFYYYFFLSAT